jgi:PAS domain S-box-containing protein
MPTSRKTEAELLAEIVDLRCQVSDLQRVVTERHRAEEQRQESEARYRTLIEHTYDFVIESSLDGRFLSVSSDYTEALGYDPDELLGKNIFEWIHPDDVLGVVEAFTRGLTQPTSEHVIYRYRHKNGDWRWFESTGRLFQTANGEARAMIVSRDITERKLAEEAQQEEGKVSSALVRVGEELSALLNTPAILDHLCRLTAQELNGTCSLTFLWQPETRQFCPVAYWGGATEQWEALRVLQLNHATIPTLFARLDQEALVVSQAQDSDLLATVLRRTFAVTESIHFPLRCGGELIGMQSVGYHAATLPLSTVQQRIALGITHVASIALENARLFEQVENANRLKSDLITTISHELRTPLHIITGYNDLLLAGEFGEFTQEQIDILQRIEHSTSELSEIVNATLEVSRLETGRFPLSLAETDINAVLQEVRQETKTQQENSPLTFSWQVADQLPHLFTDPLKLKVILKNLVHNAIKFTESGSVTVSVSAQQSGLEISVADTGIGVPPAMQAVIFDPFRQVEDPMTRRYSGVGLGLYIVCRMLELLGGSISLESTLGQGSTFRVWLPLTVHEPIAAAG